MTFNKYAKYYNTLYNDKDYESECIEIDNIIKKHLKKDNISIVDLGCGSGRHAKIFKKMGYDVVGIDKSGEMIQLAKKDNNINFSVGDITNFELEKKVDVAVSLFHVVSYLITDKELDDFFDNVIKNTTDDALLIFDVWCGHGVLTEKPEVRKKYVDNITKTVIPTVNLENQTVNMKITVEDKDKIEETHTMRYFFPRELKKILKDKRFKLLNNSLECVKHDTWNMLIVCKKNEDK